MSVSRETLVSIAKALQEDVEKYRREVMLADGRVSAIEAELRPLWQELLNLLAIERAMQGPERRAGFYEEPTYKHLVQPQGYGAISIPTYARYWSDDHIHICRRLDALGREAEPLGRQLLAAQQHLASAKARFTQAGHDVASAQAASQKLMNPAR